MGFLESLGAQFRPMQDGIDVNSPDDLNSVPPRETPELSVEKGAIASSVAVPPLASEAAGIAKVEAAQAIWGKNGRYFIIAG